MAFSFRFEINILLVSHWQERVFIPRFERFFFIFFFAVVKRERLLRDLRLYLRRSNDLRETRSFSFVRILRIYFIFVVRAS